MFVLLVARDNVALIAHLLLIPTLLVACICILTEQTLTLTVSCLSTTAQHSDDGRYSDRRR